MCFGNILIKLYLLNLISNHFKQLEPETTVPIETKHCRNSVWKVLYKTASFHFDRTTNMVATSISCFLFANIHKNLLLKPLGLLKPNFAGMVFRKSYTKIPYFVATIVNCGNHVCCPIKMKWSSFVEDLPNTIPTMLGFNWHSSFRLEVFCIVSNQKQECMRVAMCFVRSKLNEDFFL
jgi:hypothetical protein